MPARPPSPFRQVFDALRTYGNRLRQLHGGEYEAAERRLYEAFQTQQCTDYVNWLADPAAGLPKSDPTPEAEPAVLTAIVAALRPIPHYYPQFSDGNPQEFPDDQRQELETLRCEALRLARARQMALDGTAPAGAGPIVPPEWEGDDWEELDPQVRQLLLYMNGRQEADLRELCPQVWGKEYLTDGGVTEQARETTTSKANHFLRKRESNRFLRKVWREPRLRWQG